jgi:protein-S-isoprenylcysteine O-methyltransferase Ste14
MVKLWDWPPVWLAAFLALAYVFQNADMGLSLPGWVPWLAVALIVAGLGLMLLSAGHLKARKTTIIPHRNPSALVTHGVYRFSRNPIYLADVAILLGAILWWNALTALILVPVFMAVIEWRFIRLEEKTLRAHFGAKYESWAAVVRRWL